MAKQVLDNGDDGLVIRSKINDNFTELYAGMFLYGPTESRPSNPPIGYYYFDTDLNSPIFWNGSIWLENFGTTTPNNNEWQLVWEDLFASPTLDTNRWGLHPSGYSNNEQSYYTLDNVFVENGNLILKAEIGVSNPDSKPYVSGAIDTKTRFSQTYGKIEIRAKLPTGQGYWPAFWLLPDDMVLYGPWPAAGEIDIMETGGDVDQYVGTIHYAAQNNQHRASSTGLVKLPNGARTDEFNTYSIEWEPTEMRWYCNDVLIGSVNSWSTYGPGGQVKVPFPAPFDREFYLILNLAVGGNFIGNVMPEVGNQTAQVEIDWVKVYEKQNYVMPDPEEVGETIDTSLLDPVGVNLFTNGDFSDSTNNLWANQGVGIQAPVIENGELKVNILQDVDEQHLQFIRHTQSIPLVQGKYYRLSFTARSNKSVKHVRPAIDRPNAGWGIIFLYTSIPMDANTSQFTIDFQASVSDAQARFLLYMGLMAGDIGGGVNTLYFDNFVLQELESPPQGEVIDPNPGQHTGGFDNSDTAYEITGVNQIENGDFSNPLITRWAIDGNNGIQPPTIESGELVLNILQNYPEQHLQSIKYTLPISVEQGFKYRLSFNARSNKSVKHIRAAIDRPNASWQMVMLQGSFNTDPTLDSYVIDFTSAVTDANARLLFFSGLMAGDVGGDAHTIYFSNIQLHRLVDPLNPDPEPEPEPEPDPIVEGGIEFDNSDSAYTITGTSQVTNGDFADPANNLWAMTGTGIQAPTISNGELVVNILQNVYEQHLQFIRYTPSISIEQGVSYRLRFKARSGKVVKHVRVAIDRPNASWAVAMIQGSFNMDTTRQEYIIDFVSPATDANTRLLFYTGLMGGDIGGGANTLHFSDIELHRLINP